MVGQRWGEPRNLGPNVNTAQSEQVAFIHSGGETLYFSSNGRGGYGGFDVLMSKLENGVWGAPRISADDQHDRQRNLFQRPGSGDLAYFSARKGRDRQARPIRRSVAHAVQTQKNHHRHGQGLRRRD